jgi:amino acid adenylation domain-containing protein
MSDGFPLSPLQGDLWRRARAEGREPEWVGVEVRLGGLLDPRALRAALEALVQRHEILRTRFVEVRAGEPRQLVEPFTGAALEEVDLAELPLEARDAELVRRLAALRRPYRRDGSAPLFAVLARLAPDEHALLLAQSSLAADWRSLWNVACELARTLADGPDADPPAQFADVAQWLADTLSGEDSEAGLAFWRRAGALELPALRLPLEAERGAVGARSVVTRRLDAAMSNAVARLAEARRVAPEALLCGAWQATLARCAELERFPLDVRSAGRAFQGLDEALGPFERLLPFVAHVEPRLGLAALARQTDERLSHASEWHEFFDPHRLGLDQTCGYAFEHLPAVEAFHHGALTLTLEQREGASEPARLLLCAEPRADGWRLTFAHDERSFSAADVEFLASTTVAWLGEALARPDAPWCELAALDATLRTSVLAASRGAPLAPEPRRLDEWIVAVAAQHPEREAVRAGGKALSYAELERRSGALAAELVALGVGPGSRVGVHLERSLELVEALLAVLRAGGAYVPLPPSYPRERVLSTLADSRAAIVIGTAKSAAALGGFRGPIVRVDGPRATTSAAPTARGSADDLAYVIYTSGSTGKPKGVPVTHANLAHSTRARLAYYQRPVERYLLLSSFAFDSSVAGIFWTLVSGGTLVLPPENFEKELLTLPELIQRERPSHLLGLPSLWSLLLEHAPAGALASLTTVIVAGESCPPELVKRHHALLPRTQLFNEYGPTEGTVWSTVFDTAQPCARPQVPIGRPIPGAANYVLDATRRLVPPGVAGELWIGGPGVVAGYLERPELSAERFADDPFAPGGRMYKTGDRARWLADGNLEFLGRIDQQVKLRGYRIELEEIEAVLSAHPAVREAVVAARDDGQGLQLVAYVLPSGAAPAENDLLRYLGERCPEYMVPARALVLADWPRLPNGKVDRKALPAPQAAQAFAEPEGALEVVLAALFADVLGCDEVSRHDDFFARGGHSLSATRLYARLKETLQVKLPLRTLFEQRTPAALAAELLRDPVEGARVQRVAEVVLSVLEGEERALGA